MKQNIKIDPYGFREYDARWLYKESINELGIENLGKGLGTQIKRHTKKDNPRVIVGHDYRSYSEEIKSALTKGLLSTGCNVEDVGLSLSPMVYFAQFNLNADAVAMVTASHNENGWTGIKCGIEKSLTFGPEEVSSIKKTKDTVIINSKSKQVLSCPAFNQSNKDTIGAGDTFFGLCSLALSSKIQPQISLFLSSIGANFSILMS